MGSLLIIAGICLVFILLIKQEMLYSQVNQKMCYLHCLAKDIPLWPISAHTRYCWLVSFSQPQNTPNGQLLFIWYEQIHKILIVQDYQLFTNLKFWVITKTNDWRVNCVNKTTSFHVISSEQVTTPHTNTHTQTYTHTQTDTHIYNWEYVTGELYLK